MKRLDYIFLLIISIGLLFQSTQLRSKAKPAYIPDKPLTYTPSIDLLAHHSGLHTFDYLLPLFGYQKAVCRKPFVENLTGLEIASPFSEAYEFKKFNTKKTTTLGNHLIKVEGNNVYENGNTTLLIPKAYFKRSYLIFNPKAPNVIIRQAD